LNFKALLNMGEKLLVTLSHLALRLHARFRKSTQPWQLEASSLTSCPPGSLGEALYQFYHQHQYHPIPRMEYHDVEHLILEYQTDVKGEILLQSFVVGNGKKTFFAVLACVASACILPETIFLSYQAYKRGKTYLPIWHIDYRAELNTPLQQLRAKVLVPTQKTSPQLQPSQTIKTT
jgi:hypothetical protein